jgi:hypothetical protein
VTVLTAGTLASSPPFNNLLPLAPRPPESPVQGRSASFHDGAKPCICLFQNFYSYHDVRDEEVADQIRPAAPSP